MKAAVIQFQIKAGDVLYNQNTVEKYIRKAAAVGAELILLPELWNTGYALESLALLAESLNGKSVRLLQKLAAELKVYIMGGSVAEKKEGRFYNTAMAINHNGQLIEKYRKVHLFSLGMHEEQYLTAGDEWVIADTPWGKAGMAICYDLRFPEHIRNLALRGAELLAIPAEWPKARVENWRILCQARAIENQCFVLAANATGISGDTQFPGHSMIVSPFGDILAEGGEEEGVFIAELDFGLIEQARNTISVYNDRRRIIDEIDDNQI